jgi:hypothetical protein
MQPRRPRRRFAFAERYRLPNVPRPKPQRRLSQTRAARRRRGRHAPGDGAPDAAAIGSPAEQESLVPEELTDELGFELFDDGEPLFERN